MSSDNLVAVPKEINRAGKTFVQRYWMKLDAVKEIVNAKGFHGAVKALGGDAHLAAELGQSWAGSSTDAESLRAMAEVAKLVGYAKADVPVMGYGGKATQSFEAQYDKADPNYEKTILALHAVTQAQLSHEKDVVKLARGVRGSFAAQVKAHMLALANAGVPIEEAVVHIDFNPINSFSRNLGTAKGFGEIVFQIDVPKTAVLMSDKGTPGLSGLGEQEYAVMVAGPTAVKVADITGTQAAEVHAAFKANEHKVAAYKEAVAAGEIEPGTALPFNLKERLAALKKEAPPAPPAVKVPLIVQLNPGSMTAEDATALLKKAGAESATPGGMYQGKQEITAQISSDKVKEFTEGFSKTALFDSSKHTAESLEKYLDGKVKNVQAAQKASSAVTLQPEDVLNVLKSSKGSEVSLSKGYVQAFTAKQAKQAEQAEQTPSATAPTPAVYAPAGLPPIPKITAEPATYEAALQESAVEKAANTHLAGAGFKPGSAHGHAFHKVALAEAKGEPLTGESVQKKLGLKMSGFSGAAGKTKAKDILADLEAAELLHIKDDGTVKLGPSPSKAKAAPKEAPKSGGAAKKAEEADYESLTPHETKVLKAAWESSKSNGHDFGTSEGIAAAAGIPESAAGGVMASLQKKGILEVHAPIKVTTGKANPEVTQFTLHHPEKAKAVIDKSSPSKTLQEKKAAPPSEALKSLTPMEQHVLHAALKAADDAHPDSYFGKSENIYSYIDADAGISKKSLGGVMASLHNKGILHISEESAGKQGGLTKNAEYHVVHPAAAKEAVSGPLPSSTAAAPSATVKWQEHPEKATALKALGYKPNKKDLSPDEEKVITSALSAYDAGKKSGALKGPEDLHEMTKGAMGIHGVSGSTKWSDAAAEVDQLMKSLQGDSAPTQHTAASAKVAEELKTEAPPYRKLWMDYAKLGLAKGTPPEKLADAFEKAQADTKVLMAKAHLRKQKLSKYAVKTLLKKQMAKHL